MSQAPAAAPPAAAPRSIGLRSIMMTRRSPASSLSAAAAVAILLFLASAPAASAFHIAARRDERVRAAANMNMSPDADSGESAPPVPADELLSVLVHAAHFGSSVVSALSDRARGGTVQYKVDGDPRSALTLADTSAQRAIVSGLLGAYPDLNIVGEEEEDVGADGKSRIALRRDLLEGLGWNPPPPEEGIGEDAPAELDMKQVVVYVDPLDGTREFVEGRLGAVRCLIGAVYGGRPIMGAVGLPFPEGEGGATEVVFGMAGRGVGKMRLEGDPGRGEEEFELAECLLPELKRYREGETIHISTGDSPRVRSMVDLAGEIFASEEGTSRQIVGATGNKLLRVALGQTTLTILHDMTSSWDTAAPAAIISATGGRVTDYFGNPLVYNGKDLGNGRGVVASAPGAGQVHDRMIEAMHNS